MFPVRSTALFGDRPENAVSTRNTESKSMSLGNILSQYQSPESKKLAVWQKGRVAPGYDPAVWRHDENGNPIKYDEYGNRSSMHGWEMDHYPIPEAQGGSDDISNLRPLHCIANARHGGILGGLLNR
jgi:hypothetical protein